MSNPTITLNGETIEVKKPKVGYLKRVTKFHEDNKDREINDVIDTVEELICEAFKDERVTPEVLEEELDLDQFMPLFRDIVRWAMELFSGKMSDIPNKKSPASQK